MLTARSDWGDTAIPTGSLAACDPVGMVMARLPAKVTRWSMSTDEPLVRREGGEIARHELKGLVGACLILPAVFGSQTQGVVRRVLGLPALLWVGLVSYGVYLWQPAIMDELVRHNANDTLGPVLAGLASLALALVVAAISYYGMERYALRLARRVGRRPVVEKVVAPVGD